MNTAREAGSLNGVTALVVTRGNTSDLPDILDALQRQTFPIRSLVIVDVRTSHTSLHAGDVLEVTDCPEGALLVRAGRSRTLAEAIAHAQRDPHAAAVLDASRWWWILHDDSRPDDTCLAEQMEIAEAGKTLAAVGPKQLNWDGTALREVALHATSGARRFTPILPGEIDQGQYDDTSDVLAVGSAGMLVNSHAYREVGGFDPALGAYGDGLELCWRLHRAGYRVNAAPHARLYHRQISFTQGIRQEPKQRLAQLYTWCVTCPLWLFPLLVVGLLPWSFLRAIAALLRGAPGRAWSEITTWMRLLLLTPALLKGRWRHRICARQPRSSLRPLMTRRRDLIAHRRLVSKIEQDVTHSARGETPAIRAARRILWRRSLLAGSVLTLLLFCASWFLMRDLPAGVTGGAWRPLPATYTDLWNAAWATWIPGGDGSASPADPLLALFAVVCAPAAFLGIAPAQVLAALMICAPALAALSAWAAARAVTTRLHIVVGASLAWTLLPSFLLSLTHGRYAAVLVHCALPLLYAGGMRLAARRPAQIVRVDGEEIDLTRPQWGGSAGVAACVLWVLTAAHPLLGIVIGLAVLLAAFVWGMRREAMAWGACALPSCVLALPTIVSAIREGAWPALLAGSGGQSVYEASPAWLLLWGIPVRPQSTLLLVALLLPVLLLVAAACVAIVRLGTLRGAVLLGGTGLLMGAALVATHVGVARDLSGQGIAHAWPGVFYSCAAFLVLLLCVQGFPDSRETSDIQVSPVAQGEAQRSAHTWGKRVAAVLILAGLSSPMIGFLAASSLPQVREVAVMPLKADGHVIASVSDQAARSSRGGRILVLDGTETNDGMRVRLWRGAGVGLADESPLTRARALATEQWDEATADLARHAVTLVTYPDTASVSALSAHGVDTIMIPAQNSQASPASSATDAAASGTSVSTVARTARAAMIDALDRAPGIEKVGTTDAGTVWRVRPRGLQPARVRLEESDATSEGAWTNVESSIVSTQTALPRGGRLVMAERADRGWVATLNGQRLEAVADGWAQAFTVPESGNLTVEHATWWKHPWRILTWVLGAASLVALAPVRRKRDAS